MSAHESLQPNSDHLTPDERRLVKIYRGLTPRQRFDVYRALWLRRCGDCSPAGSWEIPTSKSRLIRSF